MVWSISYVQTDLAKFKGLLIKIKVIKGFSAKLKVLKDCNQIKGFKGSARGPAYRTCVKHPLSKRPKIGFQD